MSPKPSTASKASTRCSPRAWWVEALSGEFVVPKATGLFALDVGVLDDLGVFRHLIVDVSGEIVAARADRLEAEQCQPLLDVRPRDHLCDLGLELGHDRGRQSLRAP